MKLLKAMNIAECAAFISKYRFLFQVPNNEFFVKNVLSGIDEEWLNFLASLSYDQLNVVPTEFDKFEQCPPSLAEFFATAISLTALADDGECCHLPTTNSSKIRQVKAKKLYELERFRRVLRAECRRLRVNRVVDVGCGLGHLLNFVSEKGDDDDNDDWRVECVGIEADNSLCSAAGQRYGDAKLVNMRFTRNDDNCRRIIAKEGARNALISLHGCGDLQACLLAEFVDLQTHSELPDNVPLLMTIGCCYHKIRDIESWPMSAELRRALPADLRPAPPPPALRLACQERLARWRHFTAAAHDAHRQQFVNRALAECVYAELGIDTKTAAKNISRGAHRKLGGNFDEFRAELLRRNEIYAEAEVFAWNTVIDRVLSRFQDDFKYVEAFTALQFAMQGPLETLILWDRLLFLRENKIDAEILPIFHSRFSPRNMCIIGRRREK